MLCPVSGTVVLGLPIGPRPMQSQLHDLSSSVIHRFQLLEWALSPIRELLIMSTVFVLLLHQHVLQTGHHCKLPSPDIFLIKKKAFHFHLSSRLYHMSLKTYCLPVYYYGKPLLFFFFSQENWDYFTFFIYLHFRH